MYHCLEFLKHYLRLGYVRSYFASDLAIVLRLHPSQYSRVFHTDLPATSWKINKKKALENFKKKNLPLPLSVTFPVPIL